MSSARGETERDATGRVVRLRGTVADVTERRRSQEALRESEERLRLAAQAGRMYAFEWDRTSDRIVRSAVRPYPRAVQQTEGDYL